MVVLCLCVMRDNIWNATAKWTRCFRQYTRFFFFFATGSKVLLEIVLSSRCAWLVFCASAREPNCVDGTRAVTARCLVHGDRVVTGRPRVCGAVRSSAAGSTCNKRSTPQPVTRILADRPLRSSLPSLPDGSSAAPPPLVPPPVIERLSRRTVAQSIVHHARVRCRGTTVLTRTHMHPWLMTRPPPMTSVGNRSRPALSSLNGYGGKRWRSMFPKRSVIQSLNVTELEKLRAWAR